MRVQSWQVGSENREYGPLAEFEVGDVIKTSARETEMEVVSTGTTPTGGRELTVQNHHGDYYLQEHHDESVSMETGRERIRDVEVSHVE
jgi:hypothetical protein